jgi:hypothetical protein
MISPVLLNPINVQRHESSDRLAPIQDLNFAALANFAQVGRQSGFQFGYRCCAHS